MSCIIFPRCLQRSLFYSGKSTSFYILPTLSISNGGIRTWSSSGVYSSKPAVSVTKAENPPEEVEGSISKDRAAPAGPAKMDPFGIEDIDTRSSSVLVQGYFEQDWEKQKQKKNTEGIVTDSAEEANVNPNFKKYDGWLRARNVIRVREKTAGGAETLRQTGYGGIRLDSDNLVEDDGQFDEDISDYDGRRFSEPVDKRGFRQNEDEEQNSNSKSMLASEFLKKFKVEANEKIKQKTEAKREVIEDPITPQLVRRKTRMEEDQERFSKLVGPESLDSNVVPKIYVLPEYNKLTQDEMWSLLRNTVIFQNEYIFAINKPTGVPIHSKSLDCRHYITQFLSRFAVLAKAEHIYPLHRLDKETSGVLLFAKDVKIAKYLTEKFAQRQIDKKYLAVTKLCPRTREGTIKIPIGQGKVGGSEKYRSVLKPDLSEYEIKASQKSCRDAITHFKVLSSIKEASFVEVNIETGVQHQIRVHLGLGLGCPIIGDHKYSHRDKMAPQRLHPYLLHLIRVKQSKVRELPLHLHCSSMTFTLPEGATDSAEPVFVHAHVPNYFRHTLRALGLKN